MIHQTTEAIGHGITRVDTGLVRPGMAACYVMQHNHEVAIIETGTHHTVPTLLGFLEAQQIPLEQVRYIIPTHVHLDHAGGVGGLMQQLPDARLVIHPKGARHMITPDKLKAGAMAVYGEAGFARMYGDIIPVDEQRVIIAEDNDTIDLGGRTLAFLDTPGHARHHFCVYDAMSQGIFSGDTFGLAYPELATETGAFIMPTTTPVQFEPEALKASVARLMSLKPQRMYLTHYGPLENPERYVNALIEQIDDYVSIAKQHKDRDDREPAIADALTAYTMNRLKAQQSQLSESDMGALLAMDMKLNAQGLAVWLSRLEDSPD